MSGFFVFYPKTPFSILYLKIALKSEGNLDVAPSVIGVNKNSAIHRNIQYKMFTLPILKFQQNLTISKSAIIYHCSSIMDNGIVSARKLEKKHKSN